MIEEAGELGKNRDVWRPSLSAYIYGEIVTAKCPVAW